MLRSPDEADEFFRLHRALTWYVNAELRIVPDVAGPDEVCRLSLEERLDIRNEFLERLDLIDAFAAENPVGLTEDELEVVRSWRHLVAGRFYLFRQLKKFMVFLDAGDEGHEPVAYGVLAVAEPFEEIVGPDLPFLAETVLLPYRDRVAYDGLLGGYNVYFGSGIRSSLNDVYRAAKERRGIVTSLPDEIPSAASAPEATGRGKTKTTPQRRTADSLVGRWRITWMELWDQDFVDEEVEGYFEFGKNGRGTFQFGYVSGDIDYDQIEQAGKPGVEFSWDGRDEMEPASGRGWAVLDRDGIKGKICFHPGDKSTFKARPAKRR